MNLTAPAIGVLFLLAFVAAIISGLATLSRTSSPEDQPRLNVLYFEGLARSFLINLSFASISVAAMTKEPAQPAFWDWHSPIFLITVNLCFGLVAAAVLEDDFRLPYTFTRLLFSLLFVAIGIGAFSFTVYVVLN